MKQTLLFISLFLLMNGGWAQNLVPNPSFEIISSCPTAQSQLSNAIGWSKPPGSGTTPELFHECHPGGPPPPPCGNVDMPTGWAGTTMAHSGESVGSAMNKYEFCANCREYLQVQLTSPLVGGTTYDVEYYAICPSTCKYETDGVDCYIGTQVSQPGNQPITSVSPQIISGMITKAMGWTLISGTYTAVGGEQYLTLGCFKNDPAVIFNTVTGSGGCVLTSRGAQYVYDDVSVAVRVLLDVNLSKFEVSKFNETQALVEWKISNPLDYSAVMLQRSTDGVNFKTLAKELNPNEQSFVDVVPQPGVNYYRLRFTKNDGSIEMTPTQTLTFNYDLGFAYKVFPNPFDDFIQLETFNEQKAQSLNIVILDVVGQVVHQETLWMEEGRQLVQLKASKDLPVGAYIMRLEANNVVQERKLIKR